MKHIIQCGIAFAIVMPSQDGIAQTAALSEYDQLKAAVQEICPVSGKSLGSMGDPLKVKIGEEQIFLCCEGCTQGQVDKQHWSTIHKNFATAQKLCPVMEKALPVNPKSTVVYGQAVYICCPPCTKKIQADPKKFLTTVAGYYQRALKGRPAQGSVADGLAPVGISSRDKMRIAIQKICPVSGKPLGSMGTPVKERAGNMDLFLCCKGCKAGKVNKRHWVAIRGNIARAQGICPVMEKKLPTNAKSTVVNGQLVFICCPPCTKKIEKDPSRFLAKVDSYYMATLKEQSKSPTASR